MPTSNIHRNWEQTYADKATPWDMEKPELMKLVDKRIIKPCAVLELGCGPGNDAIFLAKHGFTVTAVDISSRAIQTAQQRAKKAGVQCNFIVSDATELSLQGTFGFIYDRVCFHFVPEEKRVKYVELIKRCLVPGGLFLLIASSDQDPVHGPYRFSETDLRTIFKDFEIIDLRLIILVHHKEKPQPYLCLMRKRS